MPGLVPGIHVLATQRKTWMAGDKPDHDEWNYRLSRKNSRNSAAASSSPTAEYTSGT